MKQSKGFLYFICAVSAMGGLLFGYDWVVIGGAKPFYELYFGIADSVSDQGLAMTIALIGCMIGACTCGWLADGARPKNEADGVKEQILAMQMKYGDVNEIPKGKQSYADW